MVWLERLVYDEESRWKVVSSNQGLSELLCLCCVEILKNPVHSFNALIIPILRDCLPNYFLVFLSFDLYLILN